jgi:predicted cobalt transporter CbtA
MVRSLVVRGLVAGVIAGLAAGVFAFIFGESRIDAAIALEHAHSHAHASAAAPGGHAHDALVSRDGQRAGLLLATTLYGFAVGGVFAMIFAAVRGRVGPVEPAALTARLAGALFLAVVLVPFIKYPANPPGVGAAETIGERTTLYLALLACCLLALLAAVRVARLAARRPRGLSPLAAGAGTFAATAALACALLPGVDEVPPGFPASLLWDFRLSSLGTQLVLWSVLAAGFALLSRRSSLEAAGA